MIRENQWGGVDIRRGGDPILRNNYICYGYSDGVVVGERGRGLIEGNQVFCMYYYLSLKGFIVLNSSFSTPLTQFEQFQFPSFSDSFR